MSADLRAIAEAVEDGGWYNEAFLGAFIDDDDGPAIGPADAAHIAAWSPDRALAALDVIEGLRAITEMHCPDPDGGLGFQADGEYGRIDPACRVCGTSDEYAVPWPCRTHDVARAALDRWEAL